MAQKDYEKLEGKEITVIAYDGTEFKCKVAGCHYDIGITIVMNENKKGMVVGENLVCWTSDDIAIKNNKTTLNNYKALFYHVVSQIKKRYL